MLLEIKAATEQAWSAAHHQFSAVMDAAFVTRYQMVLAAGDAPQSRRPNVALANADGSSRRVKQTAVRHLLKRLWLRQEQVLAFLDDLTIPFDNNQAEREQRTLKMR